MSDRTEQATNILVAHQRASSDRCLCGWAELGRSHAQHQAQVLVDAGLIATGEELRVDPECPWPDGDGMYTLHRRYVTPWKVGLDE